MSLTPIQLPLTFGRDEAYTFKRYVAGSNQEILDQLQNIVTTEALPGEGRSVFLHGGEGAGKSHLLQAVCHAASQETKTALYLSLSDQELYAPDILQGLEELAFVCLDDLEMIAGHLDWEKSVFHLFNRIQQCGNALVLAANKPPAQCEFTLPDLASRLQWGLTYQVQDLSDHDKICVLQKRAANRNFDLSNEVGEFMIRRLPRDMHVLCNVLDKLDNASLAAQRKLTVPFVRKVLDSVS